LQFIILVVVELILCGPLLQPGDWRGRPEALQKWLNQSRCRLAQTRAGPMNHVFDKGPERGNLGARADLLPIERNTEVWCATGSKVCPSTKVCAAAAMRSFATITVTNN